MEEQQPRKRRSNLTDADEQQMREMEAAGKTRKQIAEVLQVDPASVTRRLGAVRPYRGSRVKDTAESV